MFRNNPNKPPFAAARLANFAAYEIGSPESRAAARALLDAKTAETQRNKLRVVVECIGRSAALEQGQLRPECQRYLCADGQLMELVLFAKSGGGFSADELEALISRIPIDGKTYELGSPGANFGG